MGRLLKMVVGIALLALVAAPAFAGDSPENGDQDLGETRAVEAPVRFDGADKRLEAALKDEQLEAERVDRGRSPGDLSTASDSTRRAPYLVSLSEPARADSVLQAGDSMDDLELDVLHLWFQNDPTDTNISTGMVSVDELPDGAEAAVQHLQALYQEKVTAHLRSLREAKSRRADPAGIESQIAAVEGILRDVEAGNLRLFGFSCTCSPSGLDRLQKEGTARIRVAEEDGNTGVPVPPYDPIRRKVIQSEGRFGR